MPMLPDDLICRAILFPKAWPREVFDVEALLQFSTNDGRSYALSVASRFLLGSIQGAHEYGCRAAKASNLRFERKHQRKPDPAAGETVYYLGFYDMRCGAVQEITLEHYDVLIRWRYENGENAHFQIELDAKDGSSDKQRKKDRLAARAFLAMCLMGPTRYICKDDEHMRDELEAIDVPTFPTSETSGDYEARM